MNKEIDISDIKRIQLGILHHVNDFCRQNGVKYFLCGGSMIGAVRHHGYIPWDDDIDIMMLREDYDRFISLYTQNDTSKYRLLYYKNESSFTFPFVKIDDSDTILIELVNNKVDNMGINIDLFPIDVVPNKKSLQKRMYFVTSFIMAIMALKDTVPSSERSWFKNAVLYISRLLLHPLRMITLVHILDKNALRYSNLKSDYCGIVLWGYGMREINLRKNWDRAIEVPFEDMLAPIPEGYDNYLSCVYGDYMKLPPEDKRISHHGFNAWWK